MLRSLHLLGGLLAFLLSLPAAHAAPRRTPVVQAVQRAAPSVVSISASVRTRRNPFRSFGDDLFGWSDEYFGPQRRQKTAICSGVIIDSRGYVVTNEHVVAGAARVKVQLTDGRELAARVVGADASFDLAVLKVDSRKRLPAVRVGTARDLMPGETVIAIGNPFGLSHTVSTGVVSALHRQVPIAKDRSCEDCIQTDAAINPGNSGGALLNINGELIGINAAIRSNANNIGFAIPIDRAVAIVDDLLRFGKVRHGWIGIYPGRARVAGVAVAGVEQGSPAAQAGVRRGDVMVALGKRRLRHVQDYVDAAGKVLAGETVTLRLRRGPVTVRATWLSPAAATRRAELLLGLKVGLRLDRTTGTRGVTVLQVSRGGLAAQLGLRPGDIIRGVNQRELQGVKDYQEALGAIRPGAEAVFAIQRGGYVWYVPLEL